MTDSTHLTSFALGLPPSVPFVGPEELERRRGKPFVARLGANENGFGPSPKAIAAMQAEAGESWKYGDSTSHDLREALAARLGINPAHVHLGEGIDGILGNLVRLTIAAGDRVVTSEGAYPTFNYHVTGFGGQLFTVPFKGDHEDPEALIARASEVGAKLIYFSNPDNPMGSWHSADRVRALIESVPDGALLILDEAYVEFAPEGTAPAIVPQDPRVIRMRTFSKAYGLAGARVGYAIGETALIAAFDRVRNHFGLSRVSQAGALAALLDEDHLADCRTKVIAARERVAAIARDNGLTPLPSAANFVAIDCMRDGAFARRVLEELERRDVFVRKPAVPPQDRCIRVSVGPDVELAAFAGALPEALDAAGGF